MQNLLDKQSDARTTNTVWFPSMISPCTRKFLQCIMQIKQGNIQRNQHKRVRKKMLKKLFKYGVSFLQLKQHPTSFSIGFFKIETLEGISELSLKLKLSILRIKEKLLNTFVWNGVHHLIHRPQPVTVANWVLLLFVILLSHNK